jgi:RHH-type proline utilization regulon transcriptional repressor/proline dehydrogenase/delta 1-pyrroline-5-carboxylate dehydrogenase
MAGDKDFEFQRLHGMGDALYAQVHEQEGFDCRIYAPVGSHKELLAYLVRRLLENGANSSFVNAVNDADVPVDTLLVAPAESFRRGQSPRHPGIASPAGLFGNRRNSGGLEFGSRTEIEALRQSLKSVRLPLGDAAPLIDGKATPGTARTLRSPADEAVLIGTVLEATEAVASECVGAALDGFAGWDATPASDRAAILERAADLIEERRDRFMALLAYEGGKTLDDGIAEIREAADFCRFYAAEARRTPGARHHPARPDR